MTHKVLYIAGASRSGSTILHSILGQIDGYVALGEIREIWDRGLVLNRLCGCGDEFRSCDFWQKVLEHAFGGMDGVSGEEMDALTESFRLKHLPAMWVPYLRERRLEVVEPLIGRLADLFDAIAAVAGSRVMVDSSKNPSFGYLLRRTPGLDVYFLHLIRDAPAVAYSWSQRKEFEPGVMMPRQSFLQSALQWDARNLASELFLSESDRYMKLRYEDFVADPEPTVASIAEWIGEPAAELPFGPEGEARLTRASHSVFGNEVRFQSGDVRLRRDERWRDGMARPHKALVAALTWPLRLRYGYSPIVSKPSRL